jgi:rod shape-determining protein MreC
MVERSQKEVWRLTPWLMIALLLANFVLAAWSAQSESKQSVLKVWTQTLADFVQSPVTTATSSTANYFQSIANLRNTASENDELKRKVQELEVEVQSRQDLATENERLKSLLQLKEESKIPVLTARVVGRDPSGWFNDSIINRGSTDGVKLYMPVVSNGGLVGRVTMVSPLTAQVTLITDEKSGAGAIIGQTGNTSALGVVGGIRDAKNPNFDRNLLEMLYVPGSVEVKVGDQVFTTGQDGIYPPGLKIGDIVEVASGSTTVSHTIYIKPTSNISAMQEVAVLRYEAPPREAFQQTVPNAIQDAKGKKK